MDLLHENVGPLTFSAQFVIFIFSLDHISKLNLSLSVHVLVSGILL